MNRQNNHYNNNETAHRQRQLENDNVINNLFFRNIIAVDYQPLLGTATFELEDYTVKFSGISKYVFVQDYFNVNNSFDNEIEVFPIEGLYQESRFYTVKSKTNKKESIIEFNYCIESTLSLWLIAAETVVIEER